MWIFPHVLASKSCQIVIIAYLVAKALGIRVAACRELQDIHYVSSILEQDWCIYAHDVTID